jgi:rhodanese-related sulfurtransferase
VISLLAREFRLRQPDCLEAAFAHLFNAHPTGFSAAQQKSLFQTARRFPMTTSVKQMMEAANAAVPKITPAQARDMIGKGNTLVVDVRDAPEVEKSGKIAGAVNVSRGMLEFRADPESPYHDKNFSKDKTVILYCASGGRSALSGKVLKEMGYTEVYNVGGFKDWADSGGAVEKAA